MYSARDWSWGVEEDESSVLEKVRTHERSASGVQMKLIEILLTVGILAILIVAAAAFIAALAGGVETMLGDIVNIVLEAVGRLGSAWRGE